MIIIKIDSGNCKKVFVENLTKQMTDMSAFHVLNGIQPRLQQCLLTSTALDGPDTSSLRGALSTNDVAIDNNQCLLQNRTIEWIVEENARTTSAPIRGQLTALVHPVIQQPDEQV